MATRVVRVIRTWDVRVPVVYGDDDAAVKERVTEEFLDDNVPQQETRVLMPHDPAKDGTPEKPVDLPPLKMEDAP